MEGSGDTLETEAGQKVSFDENCNIRVLEPEKLERTKKLQDDCQGFVEKVDELNTSLVQLVDILDKQSQKIEFEKLQAVGLRNKATSNEDSKTMQFAEDQSRIAEKQRELDRLRVEYDSLNKHRQEQELMIAKLSSTT